MAPDRQPVAFRIIPAVFGFVFAGIGLTVLISLWAGGFGGFGAPPIFFRLVGSFIAVAFIAVGGTIAYSVISGNLLPDPRQLLQAHRDASPSDHDDAKEEGTYTCPKCGATIADGSDVSPRGDTKCNYCNSWFNIHSD